VTFTDVIGGVTVNDPFRWLEDDGDPAVQAWQAEQDARTVKELASSPNATAVRAALEAAFVDVFGYAAPQRCGDRWFRTAVPTGRSAAVLEVADTPAGPGRVLHDPADSGSGGTVMSWLPSPDGSRLLALDSAAGRLQVRVLDVDSGETLLDGLPHAVAVMFAWKLDGSGFFHNVMGVTEGPEGALQSKTQIWWQPLGGEGELQELTVDHPAAWPVVSADGRYAAVVADQTNPRVRWLRDLRADAGWQPFLPDATAMYKGAFVGDELWAVTNDTSGWCRLVAIPVASSADPSTWRELVAPQDGVKLTGATVCGARVVLTSIVDGASRITVLAGDGTVAGDLPLPGAGAVGRTAVGHMLSNMSDVVAPDGDSDGCTFVFSNLARPPVSFRADLVRLTVQELVPSDADDADLAIELREVDGPHGKVQYRVARRPSTPTDGRAPVVVTGYGGFNVPWLPCYWPMAAAWAALGGVWVHAQLRGGGEYDDEFWHAGRMHRKQGSFDDLYAVVEDLQRRGEASPERTGVWGSSNGGLLAGAALTQRPELFRAAVAQVPILDLLQSRKDPGTLGIQLADYGNPEDPADAPVLHAYSPYHNVKNGTSYPAVLLDAGADDTSCPPWHSRKTAARLMEATTSGHRVLLRVREEAGHNQLTADRAFDRDLEEVTFLQDELAAPCEPATE
jgi:prolyl oligopeptidase